MCISEFADALGGRLTWAMMPPLAGGLEPVRGIVIDSRLAMPGDVYWALEGPEHDGAVWVHDAFGRGALGAVVDHRHVEPWAGKFVLHVAEVNAAFRRFVRLVEGSSLRGRAPIRLGGTHGADLLHAVARNDQAAWDAIIDMQRKPVLCGDGAA